MVSSTFAITATTFGCSWCACLNFSNQEQFMGKQVYIHSLHWTFMSTVICMTMITAKMYVHALMYVSLC